MVGANLAQGFPAVRAGLPPIMAEEMIEMVRNCLADTVCRARQHSLLQGVVQSVPGDNELRTIDMTNKDARPQAKQQLYQRAQWEARG